MAKAKTGRKQLFRAALAIAGMTAGQWAAAQGISDSYLSLVLSGKRESVTVTEKIDAFIDKHLIQKSALVA